MASEHLSSTYKDQLLSLIEQDKLTWLPWIGVGMDSLELQHRMLIIGESHYQDGEVKPEQDEKKRKQLENSIKFHTSVYCTRNVIESLAISQQKSGTKIFQNLHRTLFKTNSPVKIDYSKFWGSVSFYNFIQRPMTTKNHRPSYADYRKDWQTFFALVEIIKPKICLFIGTGASNALRDGVKDSGGRFRLVNDHVNSSEKIGRTRARKATLVDNDNNFIDLVFIQHTSHHFSWKKWNNYLQGVISDELKNWLSSMLKQNS